MATFHLQIVTPDRMVFDGQAERIIVRTLRGDVCILARHIDYAAPLGIGEARVTDADGVTRVAACSGGMIGVDAGEVRVTATTFEWADDIDLERAQRAQDGHDAHLLAAEVSGRGLAKGSFDLHFLGGQVTCDLVHHQHADLFQQFPKFLGACAHVAHQG